MNGKINGFINKWATITLPQLNEFSKKFQGICVLCNKQARFYYSCCFIDAWRWHAVIFALMCYSLLFLLHFLRHSIAYRIVIIFSLYPRCKARSNIYLHFTLYSVWCHKSSDSNRFTKCGPIKKYSISFFQKFYENRQKYDLLKICYTVCQKVIPSRNLNS